MATTMAIETPTRTDFLRRAGTTHLWGIYVCQPKLTHTFSAIDRLPIFVAYTHIVGRALAVAAASVATFAVCQPHEAADDND